MSTTPTRDLILSQAVASFSPSVPSERDGLFTNANYARAVKDMFGGPILDGRVCHAHLEAMEDVEQVGPCLWKWSRPAAVL